MSSRFILIKLLALVRILKSAIELFHKLLLLSHGLAKLLLLQGIFCAHFVTNMLQQIALSKFIWIPEVEGCK